MPVLICYNVVGLLWLNLMRLKIKSAPTALTRPKKSGSQVSFGSLLLLIPLSMTDCSALISGTEQC